MTGPPPTVLSAFGADDGSVPLAGGEGLAHRSGDVVLKQVHDVDEAAWVQELLSRIEPTGVRLPTPVPTTDGLWVHEGWAAARFIDGLRPAAPSWDEIIDAGLRFTEAADAARVGGREVLARRSHRWAVADRAAWGEASVELSGAAEEARHRISALLGDALDEEHVVHGDLSGNVHVDPEGIPVVLDVSPYLRPRRWAAAIVTADAVLWHGADASLAVAFASSPHGCDLLGRALLFRLIAEQLADDPRHHASVDPYRMVIAALGH